MTRADFLISKENIIKSRVYKTLKCEMMKPERFHYKDFVEECTGKNDCMLFERRDAQTILRTLRRQKYLDYNRSPKGSIEIWIPEGSERFIKDFIERNQNV